jgi:hypothetical protein
VTNAVATSHAHATLAGRIRPRITTSLSGAGRRARSLPRFLFPPALALGTALQLLVALPALGSVKGLIPPPEHPVILAADEAISPLAINAVTIRRGISPRCYSSSADGTGIITIPFTMPSKGARSACDFAFAFEVVAGALPAGLGPIDGPQGAWCSSAFPDGPDAFFLSWEDEPRNDQDAFSFALRISAVDGTGRQGPPALVRIDHDGQPGPSLTPPCPPEPGAAAAVVDAPASASSSAGCAMASARQRPASATLPFALALALAVARLALRLRLSALQKQAVRRRGLIP